MTGERKASVALLNAVTAQLQQQQRHQQLIKQQQQQQWVSCHTALASYRGWYVGRAITTITAFVRTPVFFRFRSSFLGGTGNKFIRIFSTSDKHVTDVSCSLFTHLSLFHVEDNI